LPEIGIVLVLLRLFVHSVFITTRFMMNKSYSIRSSKLVVQIGTKISK